MTLTPQALVLNLLQATEAHGDGVLDVRALLRAAALFGLPANALRVALARAVAAGRVVAPQRGRYALGPQARPLADEVGRWRTRGADVRPWHGAWVAVHIGAVGRRDRVALRARERAFRLLGLAEFERGLHLRPDNLSGGAAALRARLSALDAAPGEVPGTVFTLDGLSPEDAGRARALWDTAALDAACRTQAARIEAWLAGAAALPTAQAAREAFELGHAAIRTLVFDPLLPDPLVDVAARDRLRAQTLRLDETGRGLWQGFLGLCRQGLG